MNKKTSEFDEKAGAWDDKPERAERAKAIAEAIKEALPFDPSFTAMEYGCGTGQVSFSLRDRFSKITLIDNSSGMLDVLREKIARSEATNMDALNIDLLESPDCLIKSFSVIYSSMVLHHVPDVKKILSAWYSHLSVPGYLCIADLDSDNGLFHGPEFTGHNGFDRKNLQMAAESTGYTGVKYKTVIEIRKIARDGVERSFPVFLLVAYKK